MDNNAIDALIEKYEYKSPSYDVKIRQQRQGIVCDSARFRQGADGVWRPKTESTKDTVSLVIAGDLLCQEKMLAAYRKRDGSGYDFNPCFDYIRPLLQSADLVIGNLETPVSETAPYRGEILTHEGPFFCNAPIEYLAALRNAGFDVLTMANNHVLDAGVRGLVETTDNCERFGLIHTGVVPGEGNRYEIFEINGFKIGLTALATSYNSMEWNLSRKGRLKLLNTYSENRAQTIYRTMRDKGAEYTIVMPHWGREYTDEISLKQQRMADNFVDIGYDLIAGSHSHVVQKFNRIAGVPVAFSLGSFISHLNVSNLSVASDEQFPILCHIVLVRSEDNEVKATINFIPCCIMKKMGDVPFVVVPCGMDKDFPHEISQQLHHANERIAERLELGADMMEIAGMSESPVSISASASQVEGCAALLSHDANKGRDKTSEDASSVNADGSRMLNQAGSLFKIFEDHAEHIGVIVTRSVVRCPKEIEGVPVTKTVLGDENKTEIRVLYTSSNTVTIGEKTCFSYPRLESVRFFNGLKSIGKDSFSQCPRLTGIVLPESLESIGDRCFTDCEELRSIKIPPNVHAIGKGSFQGCPHLVIYCEKGSFAQHFAQEHGFAYRCMPLTRVARSAEKAKSYAKKQAGNSSGSDRAHPPIPKTGKPVMGTMNQANDLPPVPILAACEILGSPLPSDAQCGKQPSFYVGANRYSGSLIEIKDILGSRFPDVPEAEIERSHRLFRNKFLAQECLHYTDADFTIYFTDWLLFARDRGFTHNCYFDYELYNKEPDIRDTFLNEGYRIRVHKACAGDKEYRHTLLDKALFNRTFSEYIHRDWIDASTCTYDEFKAFVDRHERFFSKPVRGTGGAGAHIVYSNICSLEELYISCKKNELICEEIVKQYPALANINPSTLNTVRVNTLLDVDNVPHVVLAAARFGRAGKSVDNFHGGGVGAVVDIENGQITSEAINMAHVRSPFHPDSKAQILGFQYPFWEEIKKAVRDAALKIPDMRHIGWDVSITEKGEVEFIEGNGRPNYDILQSPDQIGKKFRYEPYLSDIEQRKGIEQLLYRPLLIPLQNEYESKQGQSLEQKKNGGNQVQRVLRRFVRKVTRLVRQKRK